MNSGLLGPIIVSRKGSTKPDGTPKDVDREFVVAFAVFEENSSGYFMQNIVHDQQYPATTITNPNFNKTLEYYTMNGFIKGTMPLLTMKKGEAFAGICWPIATKTTFTLRTGTRRRFCSTACVRIRSI